MQGLNLMLMVGVVMLVGSMLGGGINVASAQEIPPSAYGCMAQMEHMVMNKSLYLALMFDSSGKAIDDLGKWDECHDIGRPIAKYCVMEFQFPVGPTPSMLGLCIPSNCSLSDYSKILTNLSHLVPGLPSLLSNLSAYEHHSHHLRSYCPEHTPSVWASPGAVTVIVISFLIAVLVAMGTLVDGFDANWWPEQDASAPMSPGGGIQETVEVQPLLHKASYKPRSKLFEFMVAFSVARNFKSLIGPSPPGLAFLNGMRAISISWIILGHSLDYMSQVGLVNYAHLLGRDVLDGSVQVFPGAEFAVDSFFWLSGFLVTYLTVKELKTKKRVNWVLYYFHRVWRLSPAYFYALFFYMFVSVRLGDGPMWNRYMEAVDDTCGKYWWTNLVYVNNFIPYGNWNGQCFLWGWYLAVDFQLYILAPFLFLAYYFNKYLGWSLVGLFIIASTVANGVFAHVDQLEWNNTNPHAYMSLVYGKPYTRAAPWLLGIACAFLYLEQRQLKRVVVYVGWIVSGVVMALCVYGPSDQFRGSDSELAAPFNTWGFGSKSFAYLTFAKLGWSLALSLLMYSMAVGWGGFFRRFLGAQFWSPLARLTYSAYLFHPIIMFVVYYSHLQYFSYDRYYMGIIYVGILVLSFCTAVVMFLGIERPMTNMEKLFLPHKKH